MTDIKITEINPNFSVITETMPNLQSASIGVFFSCGGRYENKSQQGINHLIEHMLFKGTEKKSASEISKFAESKGAVIDGFTTKETSGIYCRYFASNFDDIIGLIDEIITSSKFDADIFEKEKNVILNEISECEDNPQEYVFQLLSRALFDNHPLAYPVSGSIESIKALTSKAVRDYYHEKFLASRVCISAAGKIDHNQLVDRLQKKNNPMVTTNPNPTTKPDTNIQRIRIIKTRTNLNQLYSAAGDFTYSYRDDERYGMILLNHIWGGSMSSRLFHRIREQEGLAYSIFSFIDLYSDIGIIGAFYISNPKNQSRIFECGYEETVKLKENGVTQSELDRAINYCKSSLVLGNEDPMSRMIRNAKHQLLLNRIVTIEESIAKFEKYNVDEMNVITRQLPLNYSVVNVTLIDQSDDIKKSGGPQTVIRDK